MDRLSQLVLQAITASGKAPVSWSYGMGGLGFNNFSSSKNIAYNPTSGVHVLALPGSMYATSTNGIAWTIKTLDINLPYKANAYSMSERDQSGYTAGNRVNVVYVNSLFIMTINTLILSSTNGTSWATEGYFTSGDTNSEKQYGHITAVTWDGTNYRVSATINWPGYSSSTHYLKTATTLSGISSATASTYNMSSSGYDGAANMYTIDANKHIMTGANTLMFTTNAWSSSSQYNLWNYPNYDGNVYKIFRSQNSYFMTCGAGTVWYTDLALSNWTYSNPISSSYKVLSGAYASTVGGTYGTTVFVCSSGKIYSTSNQMGWHSGSGYSPSLTERISNTTNDIVMVEWVNDKFIAVTKKLELLTSADGITWTNRSFIGSDGSYTTAPSTIPSADAHETKPIAYSSTLKKYVWVKNTTTAYISTNGTTWTTATLPSAASHVIWTGNLFIAGGTTLMTSADGTAWTSRQATGGTVRSIASNGTTCVATHATPALRRYYSPQNYNNTYQEREYTVTYWKSTDGGLTWVSTTFNLLATNLIWASGGVPYVDYDSGSSTFYMSTINGGGVNSGAQAQLLSSSDGVSWIQTPIGQFMEESFTFGSYTYILMGGVVYKTTNGTSYLIAYSAKHVYSMATSGTWIVIACSDGTALATNDFVTMISLTVPSMCRETLGRVSYVPNATYNKWVIGTTGSSANFYSNSTDLSAGGTWYYWPRTVKKLIYSSSMSKFVCLSGVTTISDNINPTYNGSNNDTRGTTNYLRILSYSDSGKHWTPFYVSSGTQTIIDVESANGDIIAAEYASNILTLKKFTNNSGVPNTTPVVTTLSTPNLNSYYFGMAANSTRMIIAYYSSSTSVVKHAALSDLSTWSDETGTKVRDWEWIPKSGTTEYGVNKYITWTGSAFVLESGAYNPDGLPGSWVITGNNGRMLGPIAYDAVATKYYAVMANASAYGYIGVFESSDMLSWTLHHYVVNTVGTTLSMTPLTMAVNNGNFAIGGANWLRSKTSAASVYTNVQTSYKIYKIEFANGKFVAVGDSGNIYVSTDTSTWTNTIKNSRTLRDVAFTTGNTWVVAGNSYNGQTTFTISADNGVTWTDSALTESRNVLAVCADSSPRFYAAFAGGEIVYGTSATGPWTTPITTLSSNTVTSSAAYYTGSYNNYIFGCTAGYVYANLNGSSISGTLDGGASDVVNVTIDSTNAYATLVNGKIYKYDSGSWALSNTLAAKVNELLDPNYATTPGNKFYALVNPNKIAVGTTSANIAVYTTASLDNGVTYNTSSSQTNAPVTTVTMSQFQGQYNPSYGYAPGSSTFQIDLYFANATNMNAFVSALNSGRTINWSGYVDQGGYSANGGAQLLGGATVVGTTQSGGPPWNPTTLYYVSLIGTNPYGIPTNCQISWGPWSYVGFSGQQASFSMMQTTTTQTAVDPIYPTLASVPSTWNTTTAQFTVLRTTQQTPVYQTLSYFAGSGATPTVYWTTEFNNATTYYFRVSSTSTVSKVSTKDVAVTNSLAASSYTGNPSSNYPGFSISTNTSDTTSQDLATSGSSWTAGTYTLALAFTSATIASAWKKSIGRYGSTVVYNFYNNGTGFNLYIPSAAISSLSVSGSNITIVTTSSGFQYAPYPYGPQTSLTMYISTTKNTFTGATPDAIAYVNTSYRAPSTYFYSPSPGGPDSYISFGLQNNACFHQHMLHTYMSQDKIASIPDNVPYNYGSNTSYATTYTNTAYIPWTTTWTQGSTPCTATFSSPGYVSSSTWYAPSSSISMTGNMSGTTNYGPSSNVYALPVVKPKRWTIDTSLGFNAYMSSSPYPYIQFKFPSMTTGDIPYNLALFQNQFAQSKQWVWIESIVNSVKTIYYGPANSGVQSFSGGYAQISFTSYLECGYITQAQSNDPDLFSFTTSSISFYGGSIISKTSSVTPSNWYNNATGTFNAVFNTNSTGSNWQWHDTIMAGAASATGSSVKVIDPATTYQQTLSTLTSVTSSTYSAASSVYGNQFLSLTYGTKTTLAQTAAGFNTGASGVKYITVSIDKLFPATTGITATDLEIATSKTFNAMTASGNNMVAVGNAGAVYTSSDQGLTWSAATLGTSTTNNFIDVVLDASGGYVWAVTNLGEVYYASTSSLSSWSTTGANGTFGTGGSGAITARGIANSGGNIYSYGNSGTIVGTTSSATSGWTNYNMTKPTVNFRAIASLGSGADSGGYKTILLGDSGGFIAKTTVAAPSTATDFTINTFGTDRDYKSVVALSSKWYIQHYNSNDGYTRIGSWANANSDSYSTIAFGNGISQAHSFQDAHITKANASIFGTQDDYSGFTYRITSDTMYAVSYAQSLTYQCPDATAGYDWYSSSWNWFKRPSTPTSFTAIKTPYDIVSGQAPGRILYYNSKFYWLSGYTLYISTSNNLDSWASGIDFGSQWYGTSFAPTNTILAGTQIVGMGIYTNAMTNMCLTCNGDPSTGTWHASGIPVATNIGKIVENGTYQLIVPNTSASAQNNFYYYAYRTDYDQYQWNLNTKRAYHPWSTMSTAGSSGSIKGVASNGTTMLMSGYGQVGGIYNATTPSNIYNSYITYDYSKVIYSASRSRFEALTGASNGLSTAKFAYSSNGTSWTTSSTNIFETSSALGSIIQNVYGGQQYENLININSTTILANGRGNTSISTDSGASWTLLYSHGTSSKLATVPKYVVNNYRYIASNGYTEYMSKGADYFSIKPDIIVESGKTAVTVSPFARMLYSPIHESYILLYSDAWYTNKDLASSWVKQKYFGGGIHALSKYDTVVAGTNETIYVMADTYSLTNLIYKAS
jgi:hypothetical protein